MGKKILVLSASPRKGGNSDILCDIFIKGAMEAGHQTEKVYVKDKKVSYCIACEACQNNGGRCIYKDDMAEILEHMKVADVIVLATPIYFYSMDAQLKTLIDRTFAQFAKIVDKEIYMIVTGAAPTADYFEAAIAGLRGFVACLPQAKEKGIVYGIDVGESGAVKKTPAMKEAYEMGKSV